jgi:hypothetical protein
MANYYIIDCTGKLVGNKKGYKTFRGANQQANSKYSKVCSEIWNTFHNRLDKSDNLVNKITQCYEA